MICSNNSTPDGCLHLKFTFISQSVPVVHTSFSSLGIVETDVSCFVDTAFTILLSLYARTRTVTIPQATTSRDPILRFRENGTRTCLRSSTPSMFFVRHSWALQGPKAQSAFPWQSFHKIWPWLLVKADLLKTISPMRHCTCPKIPIWLRFSHSFTTAAPVGPHHPIKL